MKKITERIIRRIIKESLKDLSPILRGEITKAKLRGVSRNDVNSVLARGGDDEQLALEISVLQRTLREARGEGIACPIRGAWYGGMPAGGGYSPHKEYTVAAQRYAEAAHCILGSLGRRVGAEGETEWHSMVGGEKAHLLEEIGIMQKVMGEYSKDLYIDQFNDLSQFREEYREGIAEYSEGAIADIKKTSPKLEEKATANLKRLIAIKEAEPEFPDSVYKVGMYTYQTLGLLSRAMLKSIEGWDENKKLHYNLNAFKDNRLANRTDLLEQAIDGMIRDLS